MFRTRGKKGQIVTTDRGKLWEWDPDFDWNGQGTKLGTWLKIDTAYEHFKHKYIRPQR